MPCTLSQLRGRPRLLLARCALLNLYPGKMIEEGTSSAPCCRVLSAAAQCMEPGQTTHLYCKALTTPLGEEMRWAALSTLVLLTAL